MRPQMMSRPSSAISDETVVIGAVMSVISVLLGTLGASGPPRGRLERPAARSLGAVVRGPRFVRKPVFEAYADPRDWVAAFRRWEREAAWTSGMLITEGCVGLEERWIRVLNATAYLDGPLPLPFPRTPWCRDCARERQRG